MIHTNIAPRLICLFSILFFFTCSEETVTLERIEMQEKAYQAIISEGLSSDQMNRLSTAADELAKMYEAFVADNPEDANCPKFLFKAAELYENNLSNPNKALEHLQSINKNYQSYPQASEALFKMGFIYNNTLHDIEKAKSTYQTFLEKYPDHQLAQSARFEIQNLGLSPEEILKNIQETDSTGEE